MPTLVLAVAVLAMIRLPDDPFSEMPTFPPPTRQFFTVTPVRPVRSIAAQPLAVTWWPAQSSVMPSAPTKIVPLTSAVTDVLGVVVTFAATPAGAEGAP